MNPYVLGKLKEWKKSPLLFVTECLGATPSSQQAEFLVAAGKNKRVTIRSGHGAGKSSAAAWFALWFMSTRPYAKVVCTAPTNRQLSDILWSELSKWLRKSILSDEFVVQADKIFHKDAPKEYWIRAVSPSVKASKEDQAETLAGFHGEHLMIICDEASGIPDPVFVPLEGALTQEDNRVLLIGNPTRNTGYFYDSHFHPEMSKRWKGFHWDSRKSTNVTKEMIQYFTEKYGEGSNIFRIRVEGEPPVDDANSFIPISWALNCVGNEIEVDESWPLTLSVDVGRFGDDVSIVMPRRGNKIFQWDEYGKLDTIELANRVLGTYNDLDAYLVGVDSIGVGGGTVDWLRTDPRGIGVRKAIGVNVTEASTDNKKYHRLRDELWGKVRDNCMHGKYSFPDTTVRRRGIDVNLGNELADELSSVKYFTDNNGAIQIESKRDMKARGVKSPNIADALCISEYINPMTMALWGRTDKAKERPYNRSRPKQRDLFHQDSWMTS